MNDEDLADDDLADDDEEIMSQFYNSLLDRASKNATRPSYNLNNDESLFNDLLRRQIRTDDYPIWKIRCKVQTYIYMCVYILTQYFS